MYCYSTAGLSREVRVGLMTVLAGLVFYYGIQFLRGSDLFRSVNYYHISYDQVGGLTIGNPVFVNGLAIGKVEDIQLETQPKTHVHVTIGVAREVPVTKATVAELGSLDLLGGKSITLQLGAGQPSPNDDTLRGVLQVGMVDQLTSKAAPIMTKLDTTTMLVNDLLRSFSVTQGKLNATLDGLTKSTDNVNGLLADNRGNLTATATNLKNISAGFVKTEQSLRTLMTRLNNVGDTLEHAKLGQAINNASASLAELTASLNSVNKGKGSMGKLMKNDSLYNNMNNTAHSLDALLKDFKANPKRYVHFSLIGRK